MHHAPGIQNTSPALQEYYGHQSARSLALHSLMQEKSWSKPSLPSYSTYLTRLKYLFLNHVHGWGISMGLQCMNWSMHSYVHVVGWLIDQSCFLQGLDLAHGGIVTLPKTSASKSYYLLPAQLSRLKYINPTIFANDNLLLIQFIAIMWTSDL
jgi:hypothetical protein